MNNPQNGHVTFAYLLNIGRQNGKNDLSLVDGYVPIIAPLLTSRRGEKFDSAEIADAIKKTYGTHVHKYAIEQLVPNLAARGWLIQDYFERLSKVAAYRIADEIETEDPIDVLDVESLFRKFSDHVNGQFTRHGLEVLTPEVLESELITRLQQLPSVNIRLLEQTANDSQRMADETGERRTLTLKKDILEHEKQVAEAQQTIRLNALFVSFVSDLRQHDNVAFELLGRLAGSALLTEVVLNYHAPDKPADFNNVHFYLDGPLLMDLLDLDSVDRHRATLELIDSLRSAGASIRTFDHCVDEVKDNLKAALSAHKGGTGYRNIGIRMKLSGEFVARANVILAEVSRFIKELGITISKAPIGQPVFNIFSKAAEQEIAAHIQYGSDIGQERDASSVASILRLRGSRRPLRSDFKGAQYYLLTRNNRLFSLSEDYLIARDVYAKDVMPPCMTDRTLAVLLWLMRGNDDALAISRSLLLANCAAIPASIDAVRQTLAKLADSGKHYELAQTFDVWSRTTRGIEVLTSATMGDPTIISPDNYQEIMEEVMQAAGEDAARKERELATQELAEKDRQIAILLEETNLNKRGVEELAAKAEALTDKLSQLGRDGSTAIAELTDRLQRTEEARHQEQTAALERKLIEDDRFLKTTIAGCNALEQKLYSFTQRSLWCLALLVALIGIWIDKFSGWQNTSVAWIICACTIASAVAGSIKPQFLARGWAVRLKVKHLHKILGLAQKGLLFEQLNITEDGSIVVRERVETCRSLESHEYKTLT